MSPRKALIAGPRVLEHMVDTVLYFEGERGHQFRILRAVKNRYGPTDEIGVFEMTDRGLAEVPNPSALFLADRRNRVTGAAVFAGMEGTRPVLVEIQALVAPANYGTPRRAVVGWDGNRLAMVLAVLEARCGLQIGARDIYLNVAGGLQDRRARRRSRGRRRARIRPDPRADAGRYRRLRRDRAVGRGPARGPGRGAAQGSGQARLHRRSGPAATRPLEGQGGAGLAIRELAHLRQLVALFEDAAPKAPRLLDPAGRRS